MGFLHCQIKYNKTYDYLNCISSCNSDNLFPPTIAFNPVSRLLSMLKKNVAIIVVVRSRVSIAVSASWFFLNRWGCDIMKRRLGELW